MEETVIGIFDNAVEAKQAVQNLYNAGFSREQVIMTDSAANSSNAGDAEKEGGLSKFFKNLFTKEEDGEKYVRVARYSESVVTVRVRSAEEARTAANILERCGAVNVDERAAANDNYCTTKEGLLPGATESRAIETEPATSATTEVERSVKITRIPVLEENLQMRQPEVLTGGTRVRTQVMQTTAGEAMRERSDRIQPEQLNSDQAKLGQEVVNFTPQNIFLAETREVPVVSKVARVVEEIRVGKEVELRTETVAGTIRKTEVEVEKVAGSVAKTGSVESGIKGDKMRD